MIELIIDNSNKNKSSASLWSLDLMSFCLVSNAKKFDRPCRERKVFPSGGSTKLASYVQ